MLCDFVEHNKVSCASYYPKNKGDKTMFENFEIANIAFSTVSTIKNVICHKTTF